MPLRIETALIMPDALARAGVASLLERYSYRSIGSAASADKLLGMLALEKPRLVLIAGTTIDDLVLQASICRRQWPDCKIVLLYQWADPDDTARILASAANGCVHTSVSEHGLLRFLDFLVQEENDAVFLLKPRHEDERKQEAGKPAGGLATDEHGSDTSGTAQPGSVGEADIGPAIDPDDLSKMRKIPKLSQRELKVLEGIVRGLQNKMIAREYGIAEATVKVHMKAILRKVQVTNRTQAAVWAMENHVTQLEHSNTTGGGELPAEQPAPSGGSSHEQSGPRPALSGPLRTGSSSLGA